MYKIKQVREKIGMSQAELARRSKMSRGTIIRLESQPNAETTVRTLQAIADGLGVELADLICDKSSTC